MSKSSKTSTTASEEAAKGAQDFMEILRKDRKPKYDHGMQVLGDMTFAAIPRIGTGSMIIDDVLDGGYPVGRVVEIYGPESSGKTTLAIHAMVQGQRTGKPVAFIDVEHALDLEYAKALGLDPTSVVFEQPNSAEEAIDAMGRMIESNKFSVIVVDSVAALAPRAEIEGEVGQSHVGLQARLLGQAMRKFVGSGLLYKSGTVLIFLNQIREKIGVMFGSPETQPGGRAIKFNASVRLDIRRIGTDSEDGRAVANRVKVKVVKNKTGMPLRIAETRIIFGEGLDITGETIDFAVAAGVLEKSGSWWYYQPPADPKTGELPDREKIGQGEISVAKKMDTEPAFFALVKEGILKNNA
jgi:recombination protein RecA